MLHQTPPTPARPQRRQDPPRLPDRRPGRSGEELRPFPSQATHPRPRKEQAGGPRGTTPTGPPATQQKRNAGGAKGPRHPPQGGEDPQGREEEVPQTRETGGRWGAAYARAPITSQPTPSDHCQPTGQTAASSGGESQREGREFPQCGWAGRGGGQGGWSDTAGSAGRPRTASRLSSAPCTHHPPTGPHPVATSPSTAQTLQVFGFPHCLQASEAMGGLEARGGGKKGEGEEGDACRHQ